MEENGQKQLLDEAVLEVYHLQDQDGAPQPSMGEIGSAGGGRFFNIGSLFGETNQELTGRRGIDAYDKMRRTDGQVRATLRLAKAPLLAADWYLAPFSNDPRDLEIAEFVSWNLNNMTRTFVQFLWESLLSLDFGWYAFEKVWEPASWTPAAKGANRRDITRLKKLAPRHPRTLIEWDFDDNGGVQAMKHNAALMGYDVKDIPIKKLVIFTTDEESNNPEGLSILRSAYKHWKYKDGFYKVDAIQKERHGIGIPRGKLPPNFTPQDLLFMKEMLQNLRTNEKAFIIEMPGWEPITFVKPEGNLVQVLDSAVHHNHQIANNILASFLDLGTQSGSRAVGQVQSNMFMRALRYTADINRGTLNSFVIRQLVNYNYIGVKGYPEMRVRRIDENVDYRALSVALRNAAEAGIITPDPELEAFVRDSWELPKPSQAVLDRPVTERIPAPRGGDRVPKPALDESDIEALIDKKIFVDKKELVNPQQQEFHFSFPENKVEVNVPENRVEYVFQPPNKRMKIIRDDNGQIIETVPV